MYAMTLYRFCSPRNDPSVGGSSAGFFWTHFSNIPAHVRLMAAGVRHK